MKIFSFCFNYLRYYYWISKFSNIYIYKPNNQKQKKWSNFLNKIRQGKKYNILTKKKYDQIQDNNDLKDQLIQEIKNQWTNIWKNTGLGDIDENLEIEIIDKKPKQSIIEDNEDNINKDQPTKEIYIKLNYKGDISLVEEMNLYLIYSLETKWSDFIKEVKNQGLLTSIDWAKFEDGNNWNKITEEIRDALRNTWTTAKLDQINNNLIITIYDKSSKKLSGEITKHDVDNIKNITIELNYKNGTNDLKEKIDNININLNYSLETKWSNFTEQIEKKNIFKQFKWADFKDDDTWDKVIEKIQEQLEDTWKDAKLGDANIFDKLYIQLIDKKTNTPLTGKINRSYADESKPITIKLSYKEKDLEKKQIDNVNVQVSRSLKTKWSDFIKEVEENIVVNSNWYDNANDLTTWNQMQAFLKDRLESIFKKHSLVEIDKLNIKFLYNGSSLTSQKIGDYSNKEIVIKLSHLDDESKLTKDIPITLSKIPLSLKTKWNNFFEEVKKTNFFNNFEWSEFENDKNTWKDVIKKIRENLANIWTNEGLEKIEENLIITLWDKQNELKGQINRDYADESKPITIKLSFKDNPNLKEKQIDNVNVQVSHSLETKWSDFIKEVKDKGLLTSIDWAKFEDGNKWNKIIEEIRDALIGTWTTAKLDQINNNLIITIYDKSGKKLSGEITKHDVDNIKNINIELNYKNGTNDLKEKIDNININLNYSLETKWSNFTEQIEKKNIFKQFKWADFKDDDTWDKVIEKIQEQLEDTWKDAKLGDANIFDKLYIQLIDKKTNTPLTGKINRSYADESKPITIKLSYKEKDLEKKQIDNVNVQVSRSLKTKWSDFIKEVEENIVVNSNWYDNANDLTTWNLMQAFLKDRLESIFKKHSLVEIDKLNIKFLYNGSSLTSQKIGDYSNKEIVIKLSHLDDESELTKDIPITLSKIPLSPETKWNNFFEEVKKTNFFNNFEWSKFENYKNTWENVIKKIKTNLANIWTNKGLEKIEENLIITLRDKQKELKGQINRDYADESKPITIKLSFKDNPKLKEKEIDNVNVQVSHSLETKWSDFIEEVKDKGLLTSIDWAKFENGNKWNKITEEIRDALRDTWNIAKLDQINSNLIITIYDKSGKKLSGDITKHDVDNIKNINIELNYKNGTNDLKEKIDNININLNYSLETKWSNFTEQIEKKNIFKQFKWVDFKDDDTWDKVIRKIKQGLTNTWKDAKLGDVDIFDKLDIQLIDKKTNTPLTGIINRSYADESKPITIKLSYYKEKDLQKEIDNVNVQVSHSLKTKWSDFIKEAKDNIIVANSNWYDNANDLTTWNQMQAFLKDRLESIFKKHSLGEIDKLNIKFLYNGSSLTSQKIGDYSNKEIVIKLSHSDDESELTKDIPITLSKIPLSPETKWNNFFEEVKKTNFFNNFEWSKFENYKNTWENVIKKIKTNLANIWTNKGLEKIEENLIITLRDKQKELKGQINRDYADESKPITIKLSFKDNPKLKEKEIDNVNVQVSHSLETKWSDFIKEVQNNNLLTSINWTKFKDGDPWANVISAIKERLEENWNRIGSQVLGDINNLDIKITNNNNYLINDATIDETYADGERNINIWLSYKKETKLTNKIKDIKVQMSYSKNTRWSRFINKVQDSDITSIKWTDFTEGQLWNDVIQAIIKKLKIYWNDIDTKVLGDITNNLVIQIFDNDTLLNDENIDKIYATSEHKLTIKITYKDKELNWAERVINDVKVLVSLSKRNSWDSFIKKVLENDNKLITSIDWSKFKDGQTWTDVIEEIRKHLEKHWPTKINDNLGSISNLKIELFDKDGNKLNDKKISPDYARNENPIINIALSHNTNQSLERKWVYWVIVQVSYSLETKWEDFITKIEQNNNELINSIDWTKFKDGQTWVDVIEEIRKCLEKHWPTDVRTNLGSISSNLIIELFDKDDNKLNDKKISPDYAYHNQTIKIKLTYDTQRSLNKTVTISNFKVSTSDETNWTDFIKEIKNNKLITSIDWTEFNKNDQTWESIIESIRSKLTNAWSNNKLGSVSDLNIRLLDGTDELKGIIKDKYINNKETLITVELSYKNDSKLKEEIKINIKLDNVNFKLLRDFQDYFVKKYKYNDLKDIIFNYKFYNEKDVFSQYLHNLIKEKFNSFVKTHSRYNGIDFDFDAFNFEENHIYKKHEFNVRTTLNGKQVITKFEYVSKPFDLANLQLNNKYTIDLTNKFLDYEQHPEYLQKPRLLENQWIEIYLDVIKKQFNKYSFIKDKRDWFEFSTEGEGWRTAPNPGEVESNEFTISSEKNNKLFTGSFKWDVHIKRDKLDITNYVNKIFAKLVKENYGSEYSSIFKFKPFHLHNFKNEQEVSDYIKNKLKDPIKNKLSQLLSGDENLIDRTRRWLLDYNNYDFEGIDFKGNFRNDELNNKVNINLKFGDHTSDNYTLDTSALLRNGYFWHIKFNNDQYPRGNSLPNINLIKQRLEDYIEKDSKEEIDPRFNFKGLSFDGNRTVKSILDEIIKNIYLDPKFWSGYKDSFFTSYSSKAFNEFVYYFRDDHNLSIRIKFLDNTYQDQLVNYDLAEHPDINKNHITSSNIVIDFYENNKPNSSSGKWIKKDSKQLYLLNKYELKLFSQLTRKPQTPYDFWNWLVKKSADSREIHEWILNNSILNNKDLSAKKIGFGDDYMEWENDQKFKYKLTIWRKDKDGGAFRFKPSDSGDHFTSILFKVQGPNSTYITNYFWKDKIEWIITKRGQT